MLDNKKKGNIIMKTNYLCPKCKGVLNVGEYVIFSTRNKNHDVGLLLLHPELGNYKVVKHPDYNYEEGENLEFFCPICHKSLSTGGEKKLVKILMVDKNKTFNVLFSQIAGEKSTYKIIGDNVEAFGKHKLKYLDFLNSLDNYPYKNTKTL
ncbi:MAG: hypothetical protein DRJ01_12635 [Bacteroidetes bacterium]|nr:MAG: hypothetical protein DRJ01_12635 [Bacteroidota bacterium]